MAARLYVKFWLVTAALVSLAVVSGWYAGWSVSGLFHNQYTTYAAGAMLMLFLLGYIEVHNVVFRLFRDNQTIDTLEKIVEKRHTMEPALFRNYILNVCRRPETLGVRSRVGDALRYLSMRHDLSQAHKVKTPINRSTFLGNVEDMIANDVKRLDGWMITYMMGGFLAFLAVMYLTFKGAQSPKNYTEIADFNFRMLSGLGWSWILTIIGIGSAFAMHFFKGRLCEQSGDKLMERFNWLTFAVIFPVLHGSLAVPEESDASLMDPDNPWVETIHA